MSGWGESALPDLAAPGLSADHVDVSRQLMHATYVGQDGLGKGDVAGLKALHGVPCD